ncbi:MAG TPA: DUF2971 domain-containing protein [Ignavibacteria bacterium]|nr:DUF2971 domain-containing protein [Ignavibacteria bacterium]
MILYKYTTYENALKILLEQKFRYTQPYCFNDPFELYPIIEEYFNNEQFEEMLEFVTQSPWIDDVYNTTIREGYDKLNNLQKSIIPYEQFFAIQKNKIQCEIRKKKLPLKELIRENIKKVDIDELMNLEYHKLINSLIGILSLSSKNNNILMWGHYANSNVGVVIKINANKNYFEYLDKVHYSNDRPKIKLSKMDYTTQESIDSYKKVFFNKSLDWSYEAEYRDIKPLIKGSNLGKEDNNGFPIILFDFPIEIVEGI